MVYVGACFNCACDCITWCPFAMCADASYVRCVLCTWCMPFRGNVLRACIALTMRKMPWFPMIFSQTFYISGHKQRGVASLMESTAQLALNCSSMCSLLVLALQYLTSPSLGNSANKIAVGGRKQLLWSTRTGTGIHLSLMLDLPSGNVCRFFMQGHWRCLFIGGLVISRHCLRYADIL